MKKGYKLNIEALEQRDALSATVSLSAAGVLNIQGDQRGDYVVISNPTPATVEVWDATSQTKQDFAAASVKSVAFAAGRGDTTVYQTANVTATLTAGSGPSTYVLVATAGTNTLTGGTSPASKSYLQASGNGQTFVGTSTVNVSAKTGYALVNATSTVTVSQSVSVVTFFQPQFAGPQTQAATVQKDVNGNNILYLNPLNPTANVTYTISQVGGTVVVAYSDSTGARQTQTFTQPLSWVAFFSVSGVSTVFVNAPINSVLYGKSGSILVGGTGDVDVLKIHSGSGVAIGRAALNDLFAGPAGTTNGATLASNGRQAILRNDVSKASTVDYLNGNRDSVIIGVPALLNGDPVGRTGQVANNTDFWQLFYDLNTPGVF